MKISSTLYSKHIKLKRIADGLPTFDGGLGENPFPQPISLIESLKKYSHLKSYTDVRGIKKLRELLGEKLIIGNGLKPLLFLIQLAFSISYPNGVIYHIIPSWVSYMEQTNILNIKTKQIIQEDILGKLNPKELDNELSKTTNQTFIIFNNPTNPSGIFYNKKEIEELAKIFKKHNTIVFSDSIYSDLVHKNYEKEMGKIEDFYDNVIIGSSLSKNVGCGGYRFGWLIFPIDKLSNLYDNCNNLASSIYSCPSLPLQYVAIKALEKPKDVKTMIQAQKVIFQEVALYCQKCFEELNLKYSESKAAWYFLISFENYKKNLIKKGIYNSNKLCNYLIENYGLITVDGESFGIKNELILRYSYVDIIINKNYNNNEEECEYKFNMNGIKNFMKQLKLFLLEIS